MSGGAGLSGVQAGMEAAFNNAHLDEKTAHEECPEDVKGAFMFKVKSGISSVSGNASRVFRKEGAYDRYDFKDANQGVDKTVENDLTAADLTNPEDFPELERPKLRKVDQYCQPECPCCNLTKRYTQVNFFLKSKQLFNLYIKFLSSLKIFHNFSCYLPLLKGFKIFYFTITTI